MKVAEVVQKYWDKEGAKWYDKVNYTDTDKMEESLQCLNFS